MRKSFVLALALAGTLFASQTPCESGVEKMVAGQIPPGYKVDVKASSTILRGGYDVGNGWKAYLMDISVHQDIDDSKLKVGENSDIFFCNDSKKLVTTDLADYSGTNYKNLIRGRLISDLLKEYKDRIVTEGKGKTLVLFTDPLCPYCQMFSSKIAEAAKKNGDTLYVFSVALPMHPDSPYVEIFLDYGLNNVAPRNKADFFADIYRYLKDKHSKADISLKEINKIYDKYGIPKLTEKNIENLSALTRSKLEENRKVMSIVGAKGTPMLFDSKGANVDVASYTHYVPTPEPDPAPSAESGKDQPKASGDEVKEAEKAIVSSSGKKADSNSTENR